MTWFVDNDTLGYDPMIKYAYPSQAPCPEAFIIPMPGWKEHPLNLTKTAAMTSLQLTIFQTGQGNNARELRIAGWNEAGVSGYYKKNINEDAWNFVPYPHLIPKSEALEPLIVVADEAFKTSVLDYEKGILISPKITDSSTIEVTLLNFGQAATTSTVFLRKGDVAVQLILYKTKGLMNFIVPSTEPVYQLCWPSKQETNQAQENLLTSIFGDMQVMNVSIVENEEKVSIKTFALIEADFEFIFRKK
jgi:hypothetical protein